MINFSRGFISCHFIFSLFLFVDFCARKNVDFEFNVISEMGKIPET